MIKQDIVLPAHAWKIRVYYEVTSLWADVIMEDLRSIGIKGKQEKVACTATQKSDLNTGLTFSNYDERKTVVVVCNGSNGAQFFNSLIHEFLHVQRHICEADGIDPYGESAAYIMGDIVGMAYPKIHHLLCGCHQDEQSRKDKAQ